MADFEFETEFKDTVSKSAKAAANATAILARGLDNLSKSETSAVRSSLKLAKANTALARSLEKAGRAQRELERAQRGGDELKIAKSRARASMAASNLKLARSQRILAEAQTSSVFGDTRAKAHPLASKGPWLAAAGGAAVLAGWVGVIKTGVFAVEKSLNFAGAVQGAAKFNESLRFAFKTLGGGEAFGEKAFQESRKLAIDLGEDLGATTERMRRLLAQRFTLDQSSGLIKMLADLRLVGIEGEKADRVLMALTQIKAKGRLQAEEMLQLAEAGVSIETVYGELGKKLGKSNDELRKMQQQGKLTSDMALDAVQAAALELVGEDKAGEAGKKWARETLEGMEKSFKSARTGFMSDLGDRALPTFKKLGPIIGDITGALSPALVDKLGKTFDFLGGAIDRISPNVGKNLATGFDLAADAFDRVVKVGSAFIEGFIGGFEPFLDKLGGEGIAGVDGMTNSIQLFGSTAGATIGGLVTSLNELIARLDRIGAAADTAMQFFNIDSTSAGVSVGSKFADGITTGLQDAVLGGVPAGAALQLANSIRRAVEGVLEIKSPSRVGIEIGRRFDEGISLGLGSGFSATAAGKLGADIATEASIPARSGSFRGSPAHRAISTTNNNSNRMEFSPTLNFQGDAGAETQAMARATIFDLAGVAKLKFSVG